MRASVQAQKPTKVLLDTNIWRAITDARSAQELSLLCRSKGVQIVVAPCTVFETLRMGDVDLRNKIVRVQAASHWLRLMPEAFYECDEIIREVRRLHPEWLQPDPDLTKYDDIVRDWSRRTSIGKRPDALGFWGRAKIMPDLMASAVVDPRLEVARVETKEAQAQGKERLKGPMQLTGLKGRLPSQQVGSEIEAWRWPSLAAFFAHIVDDGAYRDWLAPWLKIGPQFMDRQLWRKFWTEEAALASMPRQWLRWAFNYYQLYAKWSSGTPADEQLSSHLIDVDHVVSADRGFIRLVGDIGAQAPFEIANGHQVSGGIDGAEALISLIKNDEFQKPKTRADQAG